MERTEKQAVITEVTERLRRARGIYFADFHGMTVEQMNAFRRELRKSNIEFKVAKNTFIKRALQDLGGFDAAYDVLAGETGIALGYDDAVEPARVLKKFIDKNEKPALKMAFIEGVPYPGKDLPALAALPSRTDLLAGIVGSLQTPASGLVGVVNAVLRDLASVIEEVARTRAA